MAHKKQTTEPAKALQEITESGNPLLRMLRGICQELMEMEVSQRIGTQRSECTEERLG